MNRNSWHIHRRWTPQPGAAEMCSIARSKDGELVAESVYAEHADFIINACKNHDSLMATLKEVRAHLMNPAEGVGLARMIGGAVGTIDAALNKAKGA